MPYPLELRKKKNIQWNLGLLSPSHIDATHSAAHQAGESSMQPQDDLPRLGIISEVPTMNPKFFVLSSLENPSSSIAPP